MLNAASMKTDQSLLDFKTGIGAAAHATLEMEQFISHMRTAIVDTITFLQMAFDGHVIPDSELHDFPNKIYDILDMPVSK